MRARPPSVGRSWLALGAFVAVAYAISWAWTFPLAAIGDVIEKGRGWPTNEPALLGPALAAFVVTAWLSGRVGLADLVARIGRWRMPIRWWAATLSPLWFLGVALLIAAAAGNLPRLGDFGRYSGLPDIGVVAIAALAILGSFGEETGWRGFALPLLQRRYSPLVASLLLTPIWALWHLPFFFTVNTYRGFPPVGYVGFVFGLACGSIILTWLYNGTGGSILACAIWHGVYNLETGTGAASGTIAAVTTTLVIVQALALVALELRARKRGHRSLLGTKPRARTATKAGLGKTTLAAPGT
jgi:membrane protease YdiL (CAAX protease family)